MTVFTLLVGQNGNAFWSALAPTAFQWGPVSLCPLYRRFRLVLPSCRCCFLGDLFAPRWRELGGAGLATFQTT